METVTKYGKTVNKDSVDFVKSLMWGGSKASVESAFNLLIDSIVSIKDEEVLAGTYYYIGRRCGDDLLDEVKELVSKRM